MNLLPESALSEVNRVHCCDLFTLCNALPSQSVDMILADLPYGVTQASWDVIIPFAPMWKAFKRVIKPRGAIVLTASQPFTSLLVCSNLEMFRYAWVWEKTNGTNFLNAPFQPMKSHEDIIIFSDSAASFSPAGVMNYYPQMVTGEPYISNWEHKQGSYTFHSSPTKSAITVNAGSRYPRSVIKFSEQRGFHPTQKPVALFEYLIKTYTQPGDLVLDPVVGSGTTALAARACGRNFICGDQSPEYVAIARERLRLPFEPHHVKPENDLSGLPLFHRPITTDISA